MHWNFLKPVDENFKNSFPEYSAAILQLLNNRKLTTQKEIDEFFNPDYDTDLHSPFLMKGMKEAALRIRKAIAEKEKIFVYGDYDADGITATAIVVKTLIFLGAENPGVYIPDRVKEGYGLKKAALEYIKGKGASLVITVDCGVANFKEVEYANSVGLEIVITDHHWVPEKIPKAAAVINTKQPGDEYPFKNLAGVGVAFKLAQALLRDESGGIDQKNKKFEKWLLDLVAIGTVADSVPLLGENRTLVKYGLIVLAKTKNIGLEELMKKANVKEAEQIDAFDDCFADKAKAKFSAGTYQADSHTISFQIAPRLNAAGRMDHANTAYELLVIENKKEAQELVGQIEKQNRSRQAVTEKAVAMIRERLAKSNNDKIIFEGDKSLPVGILGLVAGKLCDEFSRPAFIYSKGEKESAGSGRSIDSFNLIEAISECKDLLLEFGGHKGAAGFKIKNENLELFASRLNEKGKKIKEEDLTPAIIIDAVLEPEDFKWALWQELAAMAPFGEENAEPVFAMRNLIVEEIRRVGNGEKHFKFSFKAEAKSKNEAEKRFQAIAFNFNKFEPALTINDKVDVVFSIISNTWNGFSKLEMKVIDIKKVKL